MDERIVLGRCVARAVKLLFTCPPPYKFKKFPYKQVLNYYVAYPAQRKYKLNFRLSAACSLWLCHSRPRGWLGSPAGAQPESLAVRTGATQDRQCWTLPNHPSARGAAHGSGEGPISSGPTSTLTYAAPESLAPAPRVVLALGAAVAVLPVLVRLPAPWARAAAASAAGSGPPPVGAVQTLSRRCGSTSKFIGIFPNISICALFLMFSNQHFGAVHIWKCLESKC
jgi:hypothetical protein